MTKTYATIFYLLLIAGMVTGCAGTVTKIGLTTNEDAFVNEKRGR